MYQKMCVENKTIYQDGMLDAENLVIFVPWFSRWAVAVRWLTCFFSQEFCQRRVWLHLFWPLALQSWEVAMRRYELHYSRYLNSQKRFKVFFCQFWIIFISNNYNYNYILIKGAEDWCPKHFVEKLASTKGAFPLSCWTSRHLTFCGRHSGF